MDTQTSFTALPSICSPGDCSTARAGARSRCHAIITCVHSIVGQPMLLVGEKNTGSFADFASDLVLLRQCDCMCVVIRCHVLLTLQRRGKGMSGQPCCWTPNGDCCEKTHRTRTVMVPDLARWHKCSFELHLLFCGRRWHASPKKQPDSKHTSVQSRDTLYH